jgi:cholest-4-en-3-one 26-monooxygenase
VSRLPSGIVDLSDPDSFVSGIPVETFRRLRAEAPVAFHPERDGPGFWVVSKWADVRSVSLDQATFSSWKGGIMLRDMGRDREEAQREMLTGMEPRRHGKHRRLVSGTFAPKIIRALEPRLRQVVGRTLDAVGPQGACDFVTDVACELPVIAICELLGVPVEDRAKIVGGRTRWSARTILYAAGDPMAGPSRHAARVYAQGSASAAAPTRATTS